MYIPLVYKTWYVHDFAITTSILHECLISILQSSNRHTKKSINMFLTQKRKKKFEVENGQ